MELTDLVCASSLPYKGTLSVFRSPLYPAQQQPLYPAQQVYPGSQYLPGYGVQQGPGAGQYAEQGQADAVTQGRKRERKKKKGQGRPGESPCQIQSRRVY